MKRTLLFVPGNNPGMLADADVHGADCIILDLEDAVLPAEKTSARLLVRNALQTIPYRSSILIRINSVESEYWQNDIHSILSAGRSCGILLPKTNGVQDIDLAAQYLSQTEASLNIAVGATKLVALIETALGVESAFSIASCNDRVCALAMGAEDLTADLGAIRSPGCLEIAYSRSRIVIAAKAAGIQAYDTPWTDVNDSLGLEQDAALARRLGFSGKMAISPRHIDCINSIFTPSLEEYEYALEVVAAINQAENEGKGAVSLRGKMIDAPVVTRALALIASVETLKETKGYE